MKRRVTALFLVMTMFLTMTVTAMSENPFIDTDIRITNTGYADDDIVVNIMNPIPDELLQSPPVVVAGYEMEAGKDSVNPFTGDFSLDTSGDKAVARYKNGSVAVLHLDGTFEGVGYDGSRVVSNPITGLFEKELGDGTKISYVAGNDLTVRKPDGDKVTVKPDGKTTIERRNGLVSEHGSDGKITGMGLSGSNERIDMRKNADNKYTGGSISGQDGMSLEVKTDGSFSFTDSSDTTYHVSNNAGKMEAEVNSKDSFSIKADDDSLTITPNGGKEYRYEFDDKGIATVPLDNGGSVSFSRDDDGFDLIDPDGFNCSIDENGRLTTASGDGSEFALRVNPDGTIESGRFRLDENGELVEVNPDGSGTYEEDGKKLEFSVEGGLDADDFDWFQDFDEQFLSENEGNEEAGKDVEGNDVEGNDAEENDEEEESNPLNTPLNPDEWDGDIEPLKLSLRIFSLGGYFSLADNFRRHELPPQNNTITVDKKGNVEIFMPGFDFKDVSDSTKDHPDYQTGNSSSVTLKGRIRRSYRIVKDQKSIYCIEGIITGKAYYSFDYEEYEYNSYLDSYYKDRYDRYDLDVMPFDAEQDVSSMFTIYYFSPEDTYQASIYMIGPKRGQEFKAGYRAEDFQAIPDSSQDEYEPYFEDDGIEGVDLFDGNSVEDFLPMYLDGGTVDRDIWYDLTGDN